MAVDEVLAGWAAGQNGCVLRFYQWSQPTLSLGYFQPLAERDSHPASRVAACVRRPSGGGAILHDRELTYCLAVAERHPLATDAETLYRQVHGTLIDALQQRGVRATLGVSTNKISAADQPFLCFQRRATGDVLVQHEKIGGSAQWRGQGAILQHGSVILHRSDAAPEIAGLAELTATEIAPGELVELWQAEFARQLQLRWLEKPLTEAELDACRQLVETKYGSSLWNERR